MNLSIQHFSVVRWALLAVAALCLVPVAQAMEDSKAFVEKQVVLQITDNAPQTQTLVLNVANNLVKHYGQDKVAVEIVAFGPGLPLLLASNENAERIQGLAAQGVKFSACENTIRGMAKKTGKEPQLNAAAGRVPAGVVRVIDLVGEGYVQIRP